MTIYHSQNIEVSPSVRLSGPSVLWFFYFLWKSIILSIWQLFWMIKMNNLDSWRAFLRHVKMQKFVFGRAKPPWTPYQGFALDPQVAWAGPWPPALSVVFQNDSVVSFYNENPVCCFAPVCLSTYPSVIDNLVRSMSRVRLGRAFSNFIQILVIESRCSPLIFGSIGYRSMSQWLWQSSMGGVCPVLQTDSCFNPFPNDKF